jgi:hypothetical protein
MSVPRSVQKTVNEGRKKVQYCPPVRAMPANEAVLVTAARVRIGMNVNSLGWAAARDGGR